MHSDVAASRRILAACLALALVSGCAIPLGRGDAAPRMQRKRVQDKVAPSTLVADDGTWCTVSATKFAQTAVSTRAWCVWSSH